jgi:hypothetical protein
MRRIAQVPQSLDKSQKSGGAMQQPGRSMERFRQSFWVERLWTYLDAEVRILLIGMLIMILISAGILVANLID